MMNTLRNIGDLVTPINEVADKDNSTKIEHHFAKGIKLTIIRIAKWESTDGTKNYWCEDEDEDGSEQVMNEKEIIGYDRN